MNRKLFLVIVVLLGIAVFTGCASVTQIKWFPRDQGTSQNTVSQQKPKGDRPEKIIANTNEKADQIVDKLKSGDWDQAITIGEAAYKAFSGAELVIQNEKISVPGRIATKEKLLETLVEAYEYKNIINGLNEKEKELYIRTAREHLKINPSDIYKKLELSKVLLDAGETGEGFKLASELNVLPAKTKDMVENYAWGLYLSGKEAEAYQIYKTLYLQSETLNQLYHSAVVIEEFDKLLGLILYKGCEKTGNNLMVLEANINNLSAQSSINTTITRAQKAIDRLLVGGFSIDSKFKMGSLDSIVKSIVKLSNS